MRSLPFRTLALLTLNLSSLWLFSSPVSAKSFEVFHPDNSVIKLGRAGVIRIDTLQVFEFLTGTSDYQIGDVWGKRPVLEADLQSHDPVFVRSVLATAHFNTATAFYLGAFGQTHVMATNHHVLSNDFDCLGSLVQFPFLKLKFNCEALIGSWPDIDLALFTINVTQHNEMKMRGIGRNFDYKSVLYENTPLLTAGFGLAGNSARRLVVNDNADCRVVSKSDDFRLLADPDEINPADYQAWSFATGCSVSHGDSGSAMVNRKNGAVVGLVWTGAIPKEPRIQNSEYLKMLQKIDSEEIWTLLTYAVPAQKIFVKLEAELAEGRIKEPHVAVLREMLK